MALAGTHVPSRKNEKKSRLPTSTEIASVIFIEMYVVLHLIYTPLFFRYFFCKAFMQLEWMNEPCFRIWSFFRGHGYTTVHTVRHPKCSKNQTIWDQMRWKCDGCERYFMCSFSTFPVHYSSGCLESFPNSHPGWAGILIHECCIWNTDECKEKGNYTFSVLLSELSHPKYLPWLNTDTLKSIESTTQQCCS